MKFRKQICALVIALFSLQLLPINARTIDEGMWPFNNIPRAEIKKKYGFEVTDEWLKKVQADLIFAFFGFNESFQGPEGIAKWRADLETTSRVPDRDR